MQSSSCYLLRFAALSFCAPVKSELMLFLAAKETGLKKSLHLFFSFGGSTHRCCCPNCIRFFAGWCCLFWSVLASIVASEGNEGHLLQPLRMRLFSQMVSNDDDDDVILLQKFIAEHDDDFSTIQSSIEPLFRFHEATTPHSSIKCSMRPKEHSLPRCQSWNSPLSIICLQAGAI